ncbi:unnamed protein product [Thlaspi arvense]|uniref:Uncharacterized protein n=1 Tax=Thlaspi arvense TaxID=13288 RepID=A0AAU9S6G7_THLAR|nr:unnamed protein product [Thlaspi arvense]
MPSIQRRCFETDAEAELYEWAKKNPSPATIMVITGPSPLKYLSPPLHDLHKEGYTILLAYPQRDPAPDWLWIGFLPIVQREWLWKSLLEGAMDSGTVENKQETPRLVLSPWYCPDWDPYFSILGSNPFEVIKPPEPPKDDPDTIKASFDISN